MSRKMARAIQPSGGSRSGACPPHPQAGRVGRDLHAIVRQYRAVWRDHADGELDHYRGQPTLRAAIREAGMARMGNGKRHPHQYRIPKTSLMQATDALLRSPISRCASFDELYALVDAVIGPIPGIGELTVYDTSHRIGAKLGLESRRVYLHAGTRVGARALGLHGNRKFVEIDELPTPLRALSAAQVEDCLCIYKDVLAATSANLGGESHGQDGHQRHGRQAGHRS